MHKVLQKDNLNGIGNLKTNNDTFTESKKETLDLLLSTHFPDSTLFVSPTVTIPSCGSRTASNSYSLAQEIITVEKTQWAINSFKPFKSPGGDNIIPMMLQKAFPLLTDMITNLLRASVTFAHIPQLWRKVNVVFIPKPGKNPDLPKSYRPISLSSFLLKTLEDWSQWPSSWM